jgi:hypothetical protein
LMIFGLVTFRRIHTTVHPPSFIIRSAIHRVMTPLICVGEVGNLGGGMCLWGANQLVLHVFYNEELVWYCNILSYRDQLYRRHTINIGIELGVHWQKTHVEYASDVVHLHNVERWKSSPPPPFNPTTPYWEAENLWSQNLGRHPPQLRYQQFQILWSQFTITNMLKLLMLKSIDWTIPHSWRCPH